jgi:hypothetical protein
MPDPATARSQMVDSQLRARGISDPRVLDAMLRVPRHEFVPEPYRAEAYEDHPLPIGDNQTISQPYVVALMLESLQLTPQDTVLEVGTGSGYVTALLAELAAQVFSIERHPALADNARRVQSPRSVTPTSAYSPAMAPSVFPPTLPSMPSSSPQPLSRASRSALSTPRGRPHDHPRRFHPTLSNCNSSASATVTPWSLFASPSASSL